MMNNHRQNQDQQISRLHIGQSVDIQRSNGRVHPAIITQINRETHTVTVEWQEKNEGKGKELDLEAIVQLNPDLFPQTNNTSRYHPPATYDSNTEYLNGQTINRRSRPAAQTGVSHEHERKQSQPPLTSRSNGHGHHADTSPQRAPTNDANKSKTVKEIERIAANREQRRAKHDERRQKLAEEDHSIPAWEFQAMINEYRSQLPMKILTAKDSQRDLKICVCVRKRPISKKEMNKRDIDVVTIPSQDMVIVHSPKVKVDLTKYIDNQKFRFDYAFHESCNNELVYHFTAQPLVQALFEGNNPMVFAYGQTGSGKTFTMGADLSQRDLDFSRGIYALTANDIFRHMNRGNHRGKFDICCTFFEIYCTKVFDLFNEKKRLRVLEDHKNLVQVVGKKEERVDSGEEVMALIRRGMSVRTSGTTSANEHSSRSHAVFQITLKHKNTTKEFGKISLIDLAGSERGRDTQTNDKVTLMEGAQINKSLLTLKECIRALGRNAEHIPFRGSTLTKVLRDSFIGERSKVCMIAMVSPGNSDAEHTLNTLRYADRVKELNVEELKMRGAGHPHGQTMSEYEDNDDDDDYDDETEPLVPPPPVSSRSNGTKTDPSQAAKRPLPPTRGGVKGMAARRKFEQAIARSHEIEDATLEVHHELIDDLPRMVADHQALLDRTTNMNYDRDEYAKQVIHLVDHQRQHLTQLRSKAIQMREALAHEDACAKALTSK